MGRVAGAYGVRGWLKVAPGIGAADALAAASEWWIGGRVFGVAEVRRHGATLLARLPGVESREAARALSGAVVAMAREALPDPGPGHYYLADLVGVEVVNEQGEVLGVVRRFDWNGAQDVMEIGRAGRTRLVPWVAAIVKAVDLVRRRVVVDWSADW